MQEALAKCRETPLLAPALLPHRHRAPRTLQRPASGCCRTGYQPRPPRSGCSKGLAGQFKQKKSAELGAKVGDHPLASVLVAWDHSRQRHTTSGASCPSRQAAVPVRTHSSLGSCGQDSVPALQQDQAFQSPRRGRRGAAPSQPGITCNTQCYGGGQPQPQPRGAKQPQTMSGWVEEPPQPMSPIWMMPNPSLSSQRRFRRAGWHRGLPPGPKTPAVLPNAASPCKRWARLENAPRSQTQALQPRTTGAAQPTRASSACTSSSCSDSCSSSAGS